jgi:CDP-diacylglycerol--serine O-phosphatidyltransferase
MNKIRITKSLVPNLLTLVNLFCGFAAIVYTSNGQFTKAALFVLMAAVFDLLDGFTARLIKAASEFGSELDSLCDIVSFGVAPAYMLYKAFFFQFNELGILFASFPALAGATRLARFNVQQTSLEDKMYFTGLPIPSGALTIISYLIFFHLNLEIPENIKDISIFSVLVIVSLSMVSTVKYDNLPKPSPVNIKQRPFFSIMAVAAIVVSIITKGKAIFPVMLIYILGSTIRYIFIKFNNRIEPDEDIDDEDDTEVNSY